MLNINLYDVDVEISILDTDLEVLIAKMPKSHMGWIEIQVGNGDFNIMGMSHAEMDFVDDDYIVFNKTSGDVTVIITVSKNDIAKTIAGMLRFLSDHAPWLVFDHDEN